MPTKRSDKGWSASTPLQQCHVSFRFVHFSRHLAPPAHTHRAAASFPTIQDPPAGCIPSGTSVALSLVEFASRKRWPQSAAAGQKGASGPGCGTTWAVQPGMRGGTGAPAALLRKTCPAALQPTFVLKQGAALRLHPLPHGSVGQPHHAVVRARHELRRRRLEGQQAEDDDRGCSPGGQGDAQGSKAGQRGRAAGQRTSWPAGPAGPAGPNRQQVCQTPRPCDINAPTMPGRAAASAPLGACLRSSATHCWIPEEANWATSASLPCRSTE